MSLLVHESGGHEQDATIFLDAIASQNRCTRDVRFWKFIGNSIRNDNDRVQSKIFKIMPRHGSAYGHVAMHETREQEAVRSFQETTFPIIGGIAFVIEVMQSHDALSSRDESGGESKIKGREKAIRLNDVVITLANQFRDRFHRANEVELTG